MVGHPEVSGHWRQKEDPRSFLREQNRSHKASGTVSYFPTASLEARRQWSKGLQHSQGKWSPALNLMLTYSSNQNWRRINSFSHVWVLRKLTTQALFLWKDVLLYSSWASRGRQEMGDLTQETGDRGTTGDGDRGPRWQPGPGVEGNKSRPWCVQEKETENLLDAPKQLEGIYLEH